MLTILKKLRRNLLVWSTHSLALPAIRRLKGLPAFPYNLQQLAAMPAGSLGAALVRFLQVHQLKMLPSYEPHDIKHIVLGYAPDEEGEVALQCFMLGNGHRSPAVWLTVLAGLLTMPEYYRSFYKAWQRGRHTPPIEHTDWTSLMTQPVSRVQQQLHISPQ